MFPSLFSFDPDLAVPTDGRDEDDVPSSLLWDMLRRSGMDEETHPHVSCERMMPSMRYRIDSMFILSSRIIANDTISSGHLLHFFDFPSSVPFGPTFRTTTHVT